MYLQSPAPLTIPGSMQVISREEETSCVPHHPSWLIPSLTSPSPGWPNPAKEATGKVAAPNLGARLLPRFGVSSLAAQLPSSVLPFHGHGLPTAWLYLLQAWK